MKTYLTYGAAIGFASFLLTLILFFLGYHSDLEKISAAQMIGSVAGIAISIVGIALGTKARRAEVPPSEPFGYGRALGAGVMTALFGAIFGTIAYVIYITVINPGMTELLIQAQVAKFEESGMTSDQIAGGEAMMRKMMHPAIQGVFGLIGGMVYGTVIALITSAFLKRPATNPVASV